MRETYHDELSSLRHAIIYSLPHELSSLRRAHALSPRRTVIQHMGSRGAAWQNAQRPLLPQKRDTFMFAAGGEADVTASGIYINAQRHAHTWFCLLQILSRLGTR